MVADRDIYEPYEILEVRCESGAEGYGDVMLVRISSDDVCHKTKVEVVAGYVWRGSGWEREVVENSQAKWGCVGESIG